MKAHWILRKINRPAMGAGFAFAALMTVSALSAAPGPQGSLGSLVIDEAASLEAKARELRSMVNSKFDPSRVADSLQEFRSQIANLQDSLSGGDISHFNAEQARTFESIRQQLSLMEQITSNKEGLLSGSAWENRRMIRYKAANLVDRARLLGKTAQSTPLPAAATPTAE